MKKFYLFSAIAMALLTACQENEALVTITNAEINSAEGVELSASINENSTRTYLSDGNSVCWELKEGVGIFFGYDKQSSFIVRSLKNEAKTQATLFSAKPNKTGNVIDHYVAVYPYDANATLTLNYDDVDVDNDDNVDAQDGDNVDEQEPTLASYTVATTFPAVQSYKANSFGSGASPMMAIAEKGSDLGFKNVAAIIKLQLKGAATISKIVVSTSTGKKLAGACTYTMGINGSDLDIEFAEDAATTITLDCGEKGVQLSAEEATNFMFTLPPMRFEANELIFTIYDTDGYYMVQEKQDAFTAARSTISRVGKDSDGQDGYTYKINGADGYQAVEDATGVLVNEAGDYLILSAEGLAWLRDHHAEATYTLAFDIDLGGAPAESTNALRGTTRSGAAGWTPIGTAENPFKGTFNGNGKTIKGLYGAAGLFGYVERGTIKNVTLAEAIIEAAANYVGIVVGHLNGGTVENVTVKASQITSIDEALEGIGALIGYIAGKIYINDCDVKNVTINEESTDELYGEAANDATIVLDGYTPIASGVAYNAEKKTYAVSNAEGLAWVATSTNNSAKTFEGEIVKLTADIDLNNQEWTPIGNTSYSFKGTFDGDNHTISNLVVTGGSESNKGLFGYTTDGEIKNLTVENAKVSGRLNIAVVAGTPYTSKFTNITVKGHIEVNGMAYVGGVGGKNAYADWTDITVEADEASYVKAISMENGTAYRTYVGGVTGFNGEGGHTFKNITSNIDVIGSTCDVGGLFGIAHYNNNFVNCSCSADVEITDAEEADEAEELGGIAGVWHNQNGTKVTFTNCSFTGTLKANITEGVDLSDNTITGKAYGNGNGQLIIQ